MMRLYLAAMVAATAVTVTMAVKGEVEPAPPIMDDFLEDPKASPQQPDVMTDPLTSGMTQCEVETPALCPMARCMGPREGCEFNPNPMLFLNRQTKACCQLRICDYVLKGTSDPCTPHEEPSLEKYPDVTKKPVEESTKTKIMIPSGDSKTESKSTQEPLSTGAKSTADPKKKQPLQDGETCTKKSEMCPMARCMAPPPKCIFNPEPEMIYDSHLEACCPIHICDYIDEHTRAPCINMLNDEPTVVAVESTKQFSTSLKMAESSEAVDTKPTNAATFEVTKRLIVEVTKVSEINTTPKVGKQSEETAVSPSQSQTYDCRTKEVWSETKLEWCCIHKGVGCRLKPTQEIVAVEDTKENVFLDVVDDIGSGDGSGDAGETDVDLEDRKVTSMETKAESDDGSSSAVYITVGVGLLLVAAIIGYAVYAGSKRSHTMANVKRAVMLNPEQNTYETGLPAVDTADQTSV